jgi:hypothetical protein
MKKLILFIIVISSNFQLLAIDFNFFIKNEGQWDSKAKYLFIGNNANYWLTDEGFKIDIYNINTTINQTEDKLFIRSGEVLSVNFLNTNNDNLKIKENNKLVTYFNFLSFKDKNDRKTKVPTYKQIEIENVYDNINVKYYFEEGDIRYDFIVEPGGNPEDITLNINTKSNTELLKDRGIVLDTKFGDICIGEIFAFQEYANKKIEIDCEFRKEDNKIKFKVGKYDKRKELIIDPLVYLMRVGNYGNDFNRRSIQVDELENIYFSGDCNGIDFPFTDTLYHDSTKKSPYKYIMKIDSKKEEITYCTMFHNIFINELILDNRENIHVCGNLIGNAQDNFPLTENAFEKNWVRDDTFFMKIKNDGTEILYSTFLGIGDLRWDSDFTVDNEGNYYFASIVDEETAVKISESSLYPSYQGGHSDVFLLKLNPSKKKFVYTTYLGGASRDDINNILIDSLGNLYVFGITNGYQFPVTDNAYISEHIDGTSNNESVPYFTIISSDGSKLIYSTYLSDSSLALPMRMARDSSGYMYFLGWARDTTYKLTENCFQSHYFEDLRNGFYFLTKFDWRTNDVLFSSGFSGQYGNEPINFKYDADLQVDNLNNIYFTFVTLCGPLPTTTDALQEKIVFEKEGYLCKLSADGKDVKYGSYFGGSSYDYPEAMAVKDDGMVYVIGHTFSSDFPFTNEEKLPGGTDIFIGKFDLRKDIAVEENSSKNNEQIYVFPNPVFDYLNIILNNTKSVSYDLFDNIEIYDMLGGIHAVYHKAFFDEGCRVDISHLQSGIYFIRFKYKGEIKNLKFVKL